jgi:hypothetical protein
MTQFYRGVLYWSAPPTQVAITVGSVASSRTKSSRPRRNSSARRRGKSERRRGARPKS